MLHVIDFAQRHLPLTHLFTHERHKTGRDNPNTRDSPNTLC